MDRLSQLLPGTLHRKGMYAPMMAGFIVSKANEWIAQNCPIVTADLLAQSFQDGVLTVDAKSSIALVEFTDRKNDLLSYLSREYPIPSISVLKVRRA